MGGWLTEDGLKRIEDAAYKGLTDKEIAKQLCGAAEVTFGKWKRKYPQIKDAINRGRAPVGIDILHAFYASCKWQQLEEETKEIITDKAGNVVEKRIKVVKKWYPPNATAQIFALKNLYNWQDRPQQKAAASVSQEAINDVGDFLNGVK
jgi:hypothetical protein